MSRWRSVSGRKDRRLFGRSLIASTSERAAVHAREKGGDFDEKKRTENFLYSTAPHKIEIAPEDQH